MPELFHTPYFPFEENADFFNLAIEKDHPLVKEWQDIAKTLNTVIVFPFFEKRANGIYHNSAFVFERDGSIAGLYRKSHIPDDPAFYEKYYFIPGDTGFEPIKTSAGTLGVLICWDQWFPEAARIMSLKGADLLIYGAGEKPFLDILALLKRGVPVNKITGVRGTVYKTTASEIKALKDEVDNIEGKIICNQCGNKINKDCAFCNFCGAQIN